MSKLLAKYTKKIEDLDKTFKKHSKRTRDEKQIKFMKMILDAAKGKVRSDMIEDLGPAVGAVVVQKLDPGFTFEDFLKEADRLLG